MSALPTGPDHPGRLACVILANEEGVAHLGHSEKATQPKDSKKVRVNPLSATKGSAQWVASRHDGETSELPRLWGIAQEGRSGKTESFRARQRLFCRLDPDDYYTRKFGMPMGPFRLMDEVGLGALPQGSGLRPPSRGSASVLCHCVLPSALRPPGSWARGSGSVIGPRR